MKTWREKDFIFNAISSGHEPVTKTYEEQIEPSNQRLFLIKLSDDAASNLKNSAIVQTYRQQWYDFQQDYHNDPVGYQMDIPGLPTASLGQQEALYEVLRMTPLNFPIIFLDWHHVRDLLPNKTPEELGWVTTANGNVYYWWYTVLEYKALMQGSGLDKLGHKRAHYDGVLIVDEEWSDSDPVLMVSPRAIIAGAIVEYLEPGTVLDPGETGRMMVARELQESNPEVANLLQSGTLRPYDTILELKIIKPAKGDKGDPGKDGKDGTNGTDGKDGAKGDPGPAGPAGPAGPKGDPGSNGGSGDPGDPTDPPGEKYPPGGRGGSGQPPDGGYPPPSPGSGGGRLAFDCESNPIFSASGTNSSESFASFLGVDIPPWLDIPLLGVPLPDVFKQQFDTDIKPAIDAAIANTHQVPARAKVIRVVLCYRWIATVYYGISAMGLESFITKKATIPKIDLTRSNSSTLLHYILKNDALYEMIDFSYGVPGTGVELTFSWKVGEATPDQQIAISGYDRALTAVLHSKLYAAFSDFFGNLPTSPILWIGLDSVDYLLDTGLWSGHFNLSDNSHYLANPNAPPATAYFSDTPDGLVGGQASNDYRAEFWHGDEIAGRGNAVLISSGVAGRTQEVDLFHFADGYPNTLADKPYNRVRLTLKYVGAAQDIILGLHHTNSPASTTYPFSIPGTPLTIPYPPETHEFDIDISSFGITLGSEPTLHATLGTGNPGGIYLFEWSIHFYQS